MCVNEQHLGLKFTSLQKKCQRLEVGFLQLNKAENCLNKSYISQYSNQQGKMTCIFFA